MTNFPGALGATCLAPGKCFLWLAMFGAEPLSAIKSISPFSTAGGWSLPASMSAATWRTFSRLTKVERLGFVFVAVGVVSEVGDVGVDVDVDVVVVGVGVAVVAHTCSIMLCSALSCSSNLA